VFPAAKALRKQVKSLTFRIGGDVDAVAVGVQMETGPTTIARPRRSVKPITPMRVVAPLARWTVRRLSRAQKERAVYIELEAPDHLRRRCRR
jgi:hypothetical protein